MWRAMHVARSILIIPQGCTVKAARWLSVRARPWDVARAMRASYARRAVSQSASAVTCHGRVSTQQSGTNGQVATPLSPVGTNGPGCPLGRAAMSAVPGWAAVLAASGEATQVVSNRLRQYGHNPTPQWSQHPSAHTRQNSCVHRGRRTRSRGGSRQTPHMVSGCAHVGHTGSDPRTRPSTEDTRHALQNTCPTGWQSATAGCRGGRRPHRPHASSASLGPPPSRGPLGGSGGGTATSPSPPPLHPRPPAPGLPPGTGVAPPTPPTAADPASPPDAVAPSAAPADASAVVGPLARARLCAAPACRRRRAS